MSRHWTGPQADPSGSGEIRPRRESKEDTSVNSPNHDSVVSTRVAPADGSARFVPVGFDTLIAVNAA